MVSIKELAKFGLFKSQMQDLFRDYIIIIHTQTELFKLQIFLVIVSEFCSNTMYTVEKSVILLLLNDTSMRICKYC
jgi:hypothetical protein